MKKKFEKAFYNAVLDTDLYYLIYEYIRSHYQTIVDKYAIKDWYDLDNATVDTWKALGTNAIDWLETEQLPKVYELMHDDNAPNGDTWGVLYYQTLSYMDKNYRGLATFRGRNATEQRQICIECINDLRNLVTEIRELTEEDI